jgi:hypothetical protein
MKINRLFLLGAVLTVASVAFLAAPLSAADAATPAQTTRAPIAASISNAHVQNLSLKYGLGPEPHVKGVLEVVYNDANTGKQEVSAIRYQWYIADSQNGQYTALKGIHAKTIILLEDYVGKYLKCEITAQDAEGNIVATGMSTPTATAVLPTAGNPLTDWFYEAKYGLSHHFLKECFVGKYCFAPVSEQWDASKQTWAQFIDQFDVKEYAKQVNESGAKFILLTLNQNAGYYITPLAAYDKILRKTGYLGDGPNPMTSTRDLPLEIMDELAKYGIKVLLYHPCNPPNSAHWKENDYKVTTKVLQYSAGRDGNPGNVAREFVHEIISELAVRYGEKLAGFWFDSFYKGPASVYNNMNKTYNISDLATASKKGNPYRILSFNPGWDEPFVKPCAYSDYTAGENAWFKAVPSPGRFAGKDCQKMNWGVLGYLDPVLYTWGAPGVSKKTEFVVNTVKTSNQ